MPFHEEQLRWVVEVSHCRNEILDLFFRFLNLFDTQYFAFVLITFIWIGFSYRWGVRIFYLMCASGLTTSVAKHLIGWPRPSADLPGLGLYSFKSCGFPSGAATTCMLLGILLIYYWRTRAAWIIGIIYIALISFSRIYLGVHYPLDIVGGWVLGAIFAILFIHFIDPIEKFLGRHSLVYRLVLSEAIPVALWIILRRSESIILCLIAVGFGIFLSLKYKLYLLAPKSVLKGLLRGATALAIGLAISFLMPRDLYLFGLWISLGASPFCKWALRRLS